MRISKLHVQSVFQKFKNALNKNWQLDFVREEGGYGILEISKHGFVRRPFGYERRSAKEMFNTILFAMNTITYDREVEDA